jgi:DNA-binding transcriptional ArsR family regulator
MDPFLVSRKLDASRVTIAASQQLRVLRRLKLVVAQRDGRTMLYRLHDEHVASLLDEVRDTSATPTHG